MTSDCFAESMKKADVAKRPQAFHHVGLLINKHAGQTSPFFDLSSGICHTGMNCGSISIGNAPRVE